MTKSCGPAQRDEGQVKHQSRPVEERAAAAAAGRFIDVPPDLSTLPTGPSPYQGRAPPFLGYSIREFCGAVGISVSYFYELKQAGLAPRTMKLGSRRIISVEEAQKWCRERTEASEALNARYGSHEKTTKACPHKGDPAARGGHQR